MKDKNTTKNTENGNVTHGTQNETKGFSFYDEVKKGDEAQIELGKNLITDIAMQTSNDFVVIDCVLMILELFTVKDAKVSSCDLAEELQHHLFTWTQEHDDSLSVWRESVLSGKKYQTSKDEDSRSFATSGESSELENLAAHISEVMKNPLTPVSLYNAMTDELTINPMDTDSPEWILGTLKKNLEDAK
jgi:hypothetical protein